LQFCRNMDPIRILLVDDHPIVRAGYKVLLNYTDDIKVIAEADSAGLAYRKFAEIDCDVVVMDISMPDISGLDAIRKIIAYDSRAKILVFSMHEEIIFVEQSLRAGAKGYITKSNAPEVMIEAIRVLSKGQPYISADIAQHLALKNIRGDKSELAKLSTREFEIFCLLAEGLEINDIALRMSLSFKTVSNYSYQIKIKLNCKSIADLVHLAINNHIITP
jgi:two-component system, NarL family, invasion response regulator UvrY